ncbi:MAG TPA: hypothetical protein PKY10_14005 [Lentisphaeria bacterium]|nr:hypothetical protein [Lentisphaeria bacterium]
MLSVHNRPGLVKLACLPWLPPAPILTSLSNGVFPWVEGAKNNPEAGDGLRIRAGP